MMKKALFQLLVGNNDVAVKQVEQYDGVVQTLQTTYMQILR